MLGFKSLKILLYGESERFGSGAWCYFETLKDMGHQLIRFSDRRLLETYYKNVGWKVIRKLNGNIIAYHRRLHKDELIKIVLNNKPDIVIILKGLLIDKDIILKIKDAGAWIVIINHDDFFSLNKNNWSLIQRDAIAFYDYVFVTREVNVAETKRFNENVEFFPFAYYPRIHKMLEINQEEFNKYSSDVSFIGTWEKQRAELLEQLVVEVPANYVIYGSQWQKVKKKSPLFKYLKFREVSLDEMVKVVQTSKISLGFLRKENRDQYTQRTFEIPACGGLFLAERTLAHSKYYAEGIEAEFFNSDEPKELINKVKFLLGNKGKRESIRKAGIIALKKQNHTYMARLERLIEIYYQRKS
jgi:hypothetical protein